VCDLFVIDESSNLAATEAQDLRSLYNGYSEWKAVTGLIASEFPAV
jgi:hypothetical protein